MAANAQDTEVGKWLVANGAGQFADAFFEQGYEDKVDLADTAIDAIVLAKMPGVAAKLKRLLAAERAAEAKQKEKERAEESDPKAPLAIPPLPPGTALDLSEAKITASDVPPFTLRSALSVDASEQAVVSPMGLADTDWLIIAGNSRLLYGYTMGPFSHKEVNPPQAARPVLDWVVDTRFRAS